MGATLATWALLPRLELGLSLRARMVLCRMCLTAIDGDVAPWYGAGWVPLAGALGLELDKPGAEAVRRAIRELRDTKLIELETPGAPGHRAIYRLHVRPWDLDPAPESTAGGKPWG